MPTFKQKNLAELVLKKPKLIREGSKGKLVELGGYSKTVQDTPSKVLESKGFKQELAKFGLTEELITTALVFDIEGKPKNRVKELNLGAEILNMKDNADTNKRPLVVIISSESAKRYNAPITSNTEVSCT